MTRYQSQLRSDKFLFVKNQDGDVIRLGQTSRNWLALVFLGLIEIGFVFVVISMFQKEPVSWPGIGFLVVCIAGIGWLIWTLTRLLRIPPMRFDSQLEKVNFEQDGIEQQVTFSEIRRIDMSFQPDPDVELQNSGTYNIVAYLTGVRSVPIAQVSGLKENSLERAQELVTLIEEVTGVGVKPVADMMAKMKTVEEVNLGSFNVGMIAQHLGRIQQEGGQGNFVIFVVDEKANYFIKFAGQKDDHSLFAEAADNPIIPGNYKLSQEKLSKLQQLGWNPPSQNNMNYQRQWQAVSYDDRLAIAQSVIQTFVEVYGIDPDQPFEAKLNLE